MFGSHNLENGNKSVLQKKKKKPDKSCKDFLFRAFPLVFIINYLMNRHHRGVRVQNMEGLKAAELCFLCFIYNRRVVLLQSPTVFSEHYHRR